MAGTIRKQYPASIRVVRVRCTGMVHPDLVLESLNKGADGVIIVG